MEPDVAIDSSKSNGQSNPIVYSNLKKLVRASYGLSADDRLKLWPILSQITKTNDTNENLDPSQIAYNLMNLQGVIVDENTDILEMLKRFRSIELPKATEFHISTISKYITNKPIIYLMISDQLADDFKYLGNSKNSLLAKMESFKVVLSSYMPITYGTLQLIDALNPIHLKHIFVYFFSKILPSNIVDNIYDIYLLEGYKILIRFGVAVIALHKAAIKSRQFTEGSQFWDYLMNFCANNRNFDDNFYKNLHAIAFDTNRNIIEKFFRPLNISHKFLYNLFKKYENDIAEISAELNRKNTMDYKLSFGFSLKSMSTLLTSNTSTYLESNLPESAKWRKYSVKYSSLKEGYSLQTLYSKIKGYYPSILLLRPVNSTLVIGFFINNEIKITEQNRIIEDPDTFIFSLDEDVNNCKIYRWIGNNTNYSDLSTTQKQIAVFNNDCIRIGASLKNASNAIYIDNALQSSTCGSSDTFDNSPLYDNGNRFYIETIEVICGEDIENGL